MRTLLLIVTEVQSDNGVIKLFKLQSYNAVITCSRGNVMKCSRYIVITVLILTLKGHSDNGVINSSRFREITLILPFPEVQCNDAINWIRYIVLTLLLIAPGKE